MSVASSMGLEDNAELRVQSSEASPEIVLVLASQIRTGLKALRSFGQAVPERPVSLSDLPLRAVKTPDGFYEVIDGFKRLERWRASSIERRSPPSP